MIDIVKILKNVPLGTKLYSPICGECELHRIDSGQNRPYPIGVSTSKGVYNFDINGKYYRNEPGGECLLFPSKENHDWNTFGVPYVPKKGDFVYRKTKSGNEWLSIHNRIDHNNRIGEVISFVNLAIEGDNIDMFFFVCRDKDENPLCWNDDIVYQRLATEQEKADILKAIGDNGYIWDADRLEFRKKSDEPNGSYNTYRYGNKRT